MENRIRRLNLLGFDVAEMMVRRKVGTGRLIVRPKVVDAGHHQRRLLRLTGLDTEENQARRLLNDLDGFRVARACGTRTRRSWRTGGWPRSSSRR
ncbi:DUF4032 domain-containing protein [Nonomuraea recticatena]|uniref:DUF4032 domain-containing protein n=1 Tax=Nonomuraea recticatena TaxID=46178 RepID=UPI003618706B